MSRKCINVYVPNLPVRTDRRESIMSQFADKPVLRLIAEAQAMGNDLLLGGVSWTRKRKLAFPFVMSLVCTIFAKNITFDP